MAEWDELVQAQRQQEPLKHARMSVLVASKTDDIQEVRRSAHPQLVRNETIALAAHLRHGFMPVSQECPRLALGDLFPLALHRTNVGLPRADSIDWHGSPPRHC